MRIAVPVGIAAAVVQVVGLLRWPLLVPGFAADAASSDPAVAAAARDSFELAHRILGTVDRRDARLPADRRLDPAGPGRPGRTIARRWFTALGAVSAVLILAGVLTPLQLPGVDLATSSATSCGASGWSIFAILILRHVPFPRGNDRARAPPVHEAGDLMSASTPRRHGVHRCRGCSGLPDSSPSRSPASPAARSPAASTAPSPP